MIGVLEDIVVLVPSGLNPKAPTIPPETFTPVIVILPSLSIVIVPPAVAISVLIVESEVAPV